MKNPENASVVRAVGDIEEMLDSVYGHIDRLGATVVHGADAEHTGLTSADLAGVDVVAQEVIAAIPWVGGAGFVAALDAVDHEHRYWNWWTRSSEGVARLHPPRTSSGSAEYVYESMQWYRDGQDGIASVFGPFIDFAGVNQLVILCAQPVIERGTFLGIAGADLIIDRLEIQLVRLLRRLDDVGVLVGSSGRVVASSLTALAPGERFDDAGWTMTPVDEGRADWRLYTRPASEPSSSREAS
jgi:hypothetical protein